MNLAELLKQLSIILDERKQPWALIGGLAVSIRTEPRFTRDLVIAVSNDSAAEKLVFDLQTEGFRALATVEQEETQRLATARLVPSGESPQGLMLDLLFASSGIESEICENAEQLQVFPECIIPVARLSHLIALKVLARDDQNRPQDAADLQQLIAVASELDLNAALDAVCLIEKRGFNRSRNLVTGLMNAKQQFSH